MRYKSEAYGQVHKRVSDIINQYVGGETVGSKTAKDIVSRDDYDKYFTGGQKTYKQARREFSIGKNFDKLLGDIKWVGLKVVGDEEKYREFVRNVLNDVIDDGESVMVTEEVVSHNILFQKACEKGDLKLVKSLLDKGLVDINEKDKSGFSPLTISSIFGNVDICRELLDRGADTTDLETRRSICYASSMGNYDTVKLLIDNGFDVNVQNKRGSTSLMLSSGNSEIKTLLLISGADISIVNKDMHTALTDDNEYWTTYDVQDIIFRDQKWNIKLLNDKIGIRGDIMEKYPYDYYGAVVVNIYSI